MISIHNTGRSSPMIKCDALALTKRYINPQVYSKAFSHTSNQIILLDP
jgi:hypothetical protein